MAEKLSLRRKSGWPTTSRQSRGYGTAWDKIRPVILARDKGLCQCKVCQAAGAVPLIANEVHHIVSKAEAKQRRWTHEQTEADSNLQAINHDCHKRDHDAEQGRTVKAEIGADGWPK